MQAMLLTSMIILWLIVLLLVLAVVVLVRQLGIIYERIAPMGALVVDQGPETGKPAPALEVEALGGRRLKVGGAYAKVRLIFFVSPTCPVCKKMLPIVKSVAAAERDWLEVVLASDGDETELVRFHSKLALGEIPFVISATLGRAFRVGWLPYALLVDRAGILRAKGLINTREHLESLFTALELGVDSLQQYLRSTGAAPGANREPLHHVRS